MAQREINNSGQAHIKLEKLNNMLQITGVYINKAELPVPLIYQLQTEKSGKGGQSNNTQSGTFNAELGQELVLSQQTINVSPEDICKIKLSIFNKKELVSQDSVVIYSKVLNKED